MRYFRVVERNLNGTVRHEGYRTRAEAETAAAERANLLSDNSPTVIGVEVNRARRAGKQEGHPTGWPSLLTVLTEDRCQQTRQSWAIRLMLYPNTRGT